MRTESPQDFPPPVRREGETAETAVELIADFYPDDIIKPAVHLDLGRLNRGDLSARLEVKTTAGAVLNKSLTIGESVREKITEIRERYSADIPLGTDEAVEIDVYPVGFLEKPAGDSSADRVNDLLQWQQFIEVAGALAPEVENDAEWARRLKNVLGTVGDLYERNFEQLRGQLRTDRGAATLVGYLLGSRNVTLVDIALRLTFADPSLLAEVHKELEAVAADPSLGDLQKRAASQLASVQS